MDDNGRLTENVKSGEEMNRKEKRDKNSCEKNVIVEINSKNRQRRETGKSKGEFGNDEERQTY
jgi:hypothetical protein